MGVNFANILHGAQGMGRLAAGRFVFVVGIAALALTGKPLAAEPQSFPSKPVIRESNDANQE